MGVDPQGIAVNEISGGLQSLAGYLMISDDFCRYIMIYQDISGYIYINKLPTSKLPTERSSLGTISLVDSMDS